MVSQLLEPVLPQQLAELQQVIDCKVELRDLSRLAEIVQADLAVLPAGDRPANWRQTPVGISLKFGFARFADSVPVLDGVLSVTLDAVCQRCLEACRVSVNTTLRYLLLPAGADAIECEDYEVWELPDRQVRPLDIVEEALVMAMPFPALHESESECGPLAQELSTAETETAHPFAGLRAQLDESK